MNNNDFKTYSLLALVTSIYAWLLNTEQGRRFADDHTAETVVVGVGLVLGALRLTLPNVVWWRVVVAFAVGGSPMVVRSLLKRGPGG